MAVHDLDGRSGWAVPTARLSSALAAARLAPARDGHPPRLAKAPGPGPWMVHVPGWVVVVGAPPPPGEPERVEFRLDTGQRAIEVARFVGGRCVRRVGQRAGARIDEGRRGQKREPALDGEFGPDALAAYALAWGPDLDRAAACPAVRLAPEAPAVVPRPVAWGALALGVAALLRLTVLLGRAPAPAPAGAVVGGLGTAGGCAALTDCTACARCVEADRDHACAELRTGCDRTPACVEIRACMAACGSPLRPTAEGFEIDTWCRERCRNADPVGVSLYEAATRCAWSATSCPACAWMSQLPEL